MTHYLQKYFLIIDLLCKFSIFNPFLNTTQDDARIFVFNTVGGKYLRRIFISK